jgi:hypothetical protein
MARSDQPIEPMTLGNMRELGVRSLDVSCWNCHHQAVSADRWPDDVAVPTFGPHGSARAAESSVQMPGRTGRSSRRGRRLTGGAMASLNDKHRRALGILARSPNGCAEADMLAYGFKFALLADLVQSGLATADAHDTRSGCHSVTVAWMTITDAGRVAIG